MPGPHGRRIRRRLLGDPLRPATPRSRSPRIGSFAAAATGYAATTLLGAPAWAEPADVVGQPPPCWSDQVAVSASPTQGAAGHRGLTLMFTLAGGADPCTLTGYPGVDAGAGGPPIHAQPTPRGYMGGLPAGVEAPPSVTLSLSTQGHAVVEGLGSDADGNACPTYTDLAVSPPDIIEVFTVAATIDACRLEVHPVIAG